MIDTWKDAANTRERSCWSQQERFPFTAALFTWTHADITQHCSNSRRAAGGGSGRQQRQRKKNSLSDSECCTTSARTSHQWSVITGLVFVTVAFPNGHGQICRFNSNTWVLLYFGSATFISLTVIFNRQQDKTDLPSHEKQDKLPICHEWLTQADVDLYSKKITRCHCRRVIHSGNYPK